MLSNLVDTTVADGHLTGLVGPDRRRVPARCFFHSCLIGFLAAHI